MATNPILEKIQAGAAIIDVRSAGEFNEGHYPNAKNLPVNVLMMKMKDIGPKDQPVVLYCETGSRSAYAAMILKASGFKDVVNAGGLDDMPQG